MRCAPGNFAGAGVAMNQRERRLQRIDVHDGFAPFQQRHVEIRNPGHADLAFFDQPHGRGSVKGFADRGDLKKGLVVYREGMVDIGDTKPGGVFDAFVEYADRRPWLESLHRVMADAEAAGTSAIVASSALKEAYREILSDGLRTLRIVYLKGDPATLQDRLDHRVGHFMPKTMLPSQMAALEEPKDAIVVNAGQPPNVIVQQIRQALELS